MPKLTPSRELEKRYAETFGFMIEDYEAIKQKRHATYHTCTQLFDAHRLDRRIFHKYYRRFLAAGRDLQAVLPQKRGPRFQSLSRDPALEPQVIALRQKGHNRYAIAHALKLQGLGPGSSPSSVYTILRKNGLNRLKSPQKQARRTYVKERAGQLGHVDCHALSARFIRGETKKRFVVALMDDATRLVYAEVVPDLQALTVMFAMLRIIDVFVEQYQIRFEAIMTDNGSEFGKKDSKSKYGHPFERMLMELGIRHVYTPPYQPQVNGKIERFWKTLYEDLIDADYDSIEEFKDQLLAYCCYYNHERPHQGLNHQTPFATLEMIVQAQKPEVEH